MIKLSCFRLETAETIVDSLNSSLTALIATDSFESMMLIKVYFTLADSLTPKPTSAA